MLTGLGEESAESLIWLGCLALLSQVSIRLLWMLADIRSWQMISVNEPVCIEHT